MIETYINWRFLPWSVYEVSDWYNMTWVFENDDKTSSFANCEWAGKRKVPGVGLVDGWGESQQKDCMKSGGFCGKKMFYFFVNQGR